MKNNSQDTDESSRLGSVDSDDHHAGSNRPSACVDQHANGHSSLVPGLAVSLTSLRVLTLPTIAVLGGCLVVAFKRGIEYIFVSPYCDSFRLDWADVAIYQVIVLCAAFLAAPWIRFIPAVRVTRRAFLVGMFLTTLLLTNAVSWLVLEHFPGDLDNVAKLFQAKVFSELRLTVDEPAHPEFFVHYAMVSHNGKYFAKYPPVTSLVFALCMMLSGVAWWANPLLGSLALVFFYLVFEAWYGERTARLAAMFMLLSPFYIFMASNYHSHIPCLFFLAGYLLMLTKGASTHRWAFFALAGLSLGMAFGVRPYTAFLMSVPGVIWLLAMSEVRDWWKRLLWFSVGFAVPFALHLAYNAYLTGNPVHFPFHLGGANERIGFGYNGHTPAKGLETAATMMTVLNQMLLGWPISVLPCVCFLLIGRKNRFDWLTVALLAAPAVGQFFYYFTDYSFGPRYYFAATPFLVVLAARACMTVPQWFRAIPAERTRSFVVALLVCSFAFSFTCYVPVLVRNYGDNYNGLVNTRIADLARDQQIDRALVFFEDIEPVNILSYSFLANTTDFDGDIIYAESLGQEEDQELMDAHPNRACYMYVYDVDQAEGILEPYGSFWHDSPRLREQGAAPTIGFPQPYETGMFGTVMASWGVEIVDRSCRVRLLLMCSKPLPWPFGLATQNHCYAAGSR